MRTLPLLCIEKKITETGYHLGPRITKAFFGWRRTVRQWTEVEQLEQLTQELAVWSGTRADFVVVYQINSPPPDSADLNAFGWRRFDGTWRAVADVLRHTWPAAD